MLRNLHFFLFCLREITRHSETAVCHYVSRHTVPVHVSTDARFRSVPQYTHPYRHTHTHRHCFLPAKELRLKTVSFFFPPPLCSPTQWFVAIISSSIWFVASCLVFLRHLDGAYLSCIVDNFAVHTRTSTHASQVANSTAFSLSPFFLITALHEC